MFRTNIVFVFSFRTNKKIWTIYLNSLGFSLWGILVTRPCSNSHLWLSPPLSCPGCWGGSGLSGHHVHADLSWPRPWVPAVPWRGGGARGRGGRREQGEGIGQRQCRGKHSGFRHLGRAHQTGRQGGHTGGSIFPWREVSTLVSFVISTICLITDSWSLHIRACSSNLHLIVSWFTDFALCGFFELDAPIMSILISVWYKT